MREQPPPELRADLKFDEPAALAAFQQACAKAIARATSDIEHEHARLTESIRAAGAAGRGLELASIQQAERAVVIDFEFDRHTEARQIGLNLGHQYGWERSAELSVPLPGGAYRAVIIVTKR